MNSNISAWAIRNPLPSILLFAVLTIVGLYSFSRLPVTYFPTIDVPQVSVTIEQPGVTPAELETEVTRLVENSIASLTGIKEMTSTLSEGRSTTTVEFELGVVSTDRAIADVRDAIAKIRSDLPDDIDEPVIERIEEEAQAVATYAVSSRNMTAEEISWFIDDVLIRDLQGLAGVGRIDRVGGVDREIHLELDADRLHAFSLTASAVNEGLMTTQLDLSGGRSEINGRERSVSTNAAAKSISDLADLRIALTGDNHIRLGELGTIDDTFAEPRVFAALDGAEVAGFSIFRSQGASDVSVAAAVAAAVSDLGARYPDVDFSLVDESVSYTAGNYHSAMNTLLEGAALAVVVVFLFLRDWRATLVAAVALPLSIIPTFFVIDMLGFSLNIISLLAITLVTGILVDDAIVEIENVVRHRNMGKSAWRAALDASGEIGLAVIAISATIIAVFAPVGMMSGIVGLYFREFGLTVAIAVFFSLLVARMITPIMAAYIMTTRPPKKQQKGLPGRTYERFLRLTLHWRRMTVALAIGLFVLSMMSLMSLPTAFLPEEDTGRLTMSVELPSGSTLEETRLASDEIARRIGTLDEVEGVFVRGGASPTGQQDVRRAAVSIDLVHKSERARSSFAIQADIEKILSAIPDVRLQFLNGRGGRDISFAVLNTDGEAAQQAADAILAEMALDGAYVNPSSDTAAMRPELRMDVQADKAAVLGVSTASIAQTIRVSTVGDVDSRLPTFIDGSRQIPIRLLLGREARDDMPTLELLGVPTANGQQVPLSSLVDFSFDQTVSAIERLDRERRIEISADMAGEMTSGQGLDRLRQLESVRNLPDGVRILETGDSDTQGNVFESFAVAMGSGIMLVLVVLILLFGSLLTPWTILAALPLSIGGVAAALVLTGSAISLPVVIGILMLMGIVTKNSIMLVDFAVEREAHDLSRFDAIVEACSERARPIVMTTLAMTAGMVPSALGIGDGGEFRAPMAIAVIGGLLVSTVLSLIVIPALHLIVSNFSDRVARIFRPVLQSSEMHAYETEAAGRSAG
ncbi:efflux RND transporter permease subunit [Rhizobiaceae bacterium BDR2-2]|uniref:Efflux RND transporter permease subunit n=1 Tax=Ectorhizobium quercum TaxID=2965071 RepID=A0AAE3ST25_9HYPH|nr:efflux RND transporter permease subunit [Ectorhizobium quercum]MCX8995705.1 efflux RND transporter permease subunit [Ectorhizobium quercum]